MDLPLFRGTFLMNYADLAGASHDLPWEERLTVEEEEEVVVGGETNHMAVGVVWTCI